MPGRVNERLPFRPGVAGAAITRRSRVFPTVLRLAYLNFLPLSKRLLLAVSRHA